MSAVTTPVRAMASSPKLSTPPQCARARSTFGVPARPTVRTRVRRRAARPVVSGAASIDGDAPSEGATRDTAPRVTPGTFAEGDTVASAGGTTLVVRRLLGRGSFGTTYECERPDGDVVALKVLALRDLRNWKALQLFEREAKILKSLSHPAIPEYVDYFEIDTEGDVKFCLVQRIAPGESLQTLVDGGWRPTEDDVVSVAEQLLEVLAYLGSLQTPGGAPRRETRQYPPRSCHRKSESGGLRRHRGRGDDGCGGGGPGRIRPGSTMIGTFGYAAPEQMMGAVTPVSDLYSAGATLLFLLSGRAPSTMPSSRLRVDFRGAVTIENPRLEAVIARSLEPYPEDRHENAREALDALQKTRTGSAGGRMFGRPDKKERAAREARERAAREEQESRSFFDDDDDDEEGGVVFSPNQRSPQRDYCSPTRARTSAFASPRARASSPSARGRRVAVGDSPGGSLVLGRLHGDVCRRLERVCGDVDGGGTRERRGVIRAVQRALLVGGAPWSSRRGTKSSRRPVWSWTRRRGRTRSASPPRGSSPEANEGKLADLRGAKLVVDVVNNGVPNMCLVLEAGATPVKFGRGLQDIELEYVAAEINAFVDAFA